MKTKALKTSNNRQSDRLSEAQRKAAKEFRKARKAPRGKGYSLELMGV